MKKLMTTTEGVNGGDLADWDYDRAAEEFHRDAAARALALVSAYRAEPGDVQGWKVLTDDLLPALPPEGSPLRASWTERNRRLMATLLALASLASRVVDVAYADQDEWLADQQEVLSRPE